MKIDRTQQVYVIFNEDLNRTKIGVSENALLRKNNLASGCGCNMKLVYASDRVLGAEHYEALAHDELKEYRHIGEWFNIEPEMAVSIVKRLVENAQKDTIIEAYKNGESINTICSEIGMSRSGVIKHLKRSGVYDTFKSVTTEQVKVKKPHLFKVGFSGEYGIRVSQNIYTDRDKSLYCYRIYSEGCFKERFFDTLEKAKRFRDRSVI